MSQSHTLKPLPYTAFKTPSLKAIGVGEFGPFEHELPALFACFLQQMLCFF